MGFTYDAIRVKYDSVLVLSGYQRGVKKFLSKRENLCFLQENMLPFFSQCVKYFGWQCT